MQTTKLSSKGQVIIPKTLRSRYNLRTGQELWVIDTGDGILLKPSHPFKKTELDHVAGIFDSGLAHDGRHVASQADHGVNRDFALSGHTDHGFEQVAPALEEVTPIT